MHGEIQNVQLRLVQFVDHEADDLLALLGDHADAVALAEAAEEVFLGPGELEALLLGLEDLGHVAADHPADVAADLLLLRPVSAHVRPLLFSPATARGVSLRGGATLPRNLRFTFRLRPK